MFDEIAKIWLQDQYQALTLDAAMAQPEPGEDDPKDEFGPVIDAEAGLVMGNVEELESAVVIKGGVEGQLGKGPRRGEATGTGAGTGRKGLKS